MPLHSFETFLEFKVYVHGESKGRVRIIDDYPEKRKKR